MSTHEPPDLPGCFSQAFVGRSVAIVAAYLMVTQGLDPDGALETIRKARPDVQYVPSSSESNVISLKRTAIRPNEGFMRQLHIFYQTSFKVSKRDKETRMFYLERVVNEVMSESNLLLSISFSRSSHVRCRSTCESSVIDANLALFLDPHVRQRLSTLC